MQMHPCKTSSLDYRELDKNYTLGMVIGSCTLTNLQGTSLLQYLLELSTLLLRHCVITTANELATNKHTGYRATTCQLVQVVLNCFTILPLVKLHTEDTMVKRLATIMTT